MKKILSSKIAGLLVISMMSVTVGVIPVFAAVTTSLYPNGQGTYTAWSGTESDIDEAGAPDCTAMEGVYTGNTNDRESVVIDLSSIPNGSTITSVDVVVAYRDSVLSGDNGTFKTFTRFNGTDLDATSNIVASSGTCSSTTQTLNVADAVKNGATTLEVGVLKTANDTSTVFVGAIHAIVTYTSTNTAPVAQAKSITINEDTATTSGVLATDVDLPAQVLTYSVVANPSHGAISGFSSTTGAFTYTPALNYNGSDSFTFKANDGTVDSNIATVSITVNSVNDNPVLSGVSNKTVGELSNLSFTVSSTDVDGGTPSYSLSSAPAGASIGSSNGVFSWTPTEAQGPGSYTFSVVVSAGNGGSDTDPITVTVEEVNITPTGATQTVSTHLNTSKTITFTGVDGDIPTQTLVYAISTPASVGTLGAVSGNQVTYTPSTNFVGADSFSYTVGDGTATSSAYTININVTDDAPVLNAIGTLSGDEETEISFTASAMDPNSDPIAYSLSGAPTGASIDSVTGTFSFTPTEAQGPGSYTFSVIVSDGAISDSETVTINVNEVNKVPTATGKTEGSALTTPEDTLLSGTLTATDVDVPVQALTYATTSNPSHGTIASFDPTSGVFTYVPDLNYYGNDAFTFKVSDGVVDSVDATIEIKVTSVNDIPVVTLLGSSHLLTTVNYPNVQLDATAYDVEDGDVTPSIMRTGAYDITKEGEYTLVYSATDSDEATGYATRTVIVLPQLGGSGGTDGTPGCKDPKASNYNPSAVYDGTCTYAPVGEVLGASTSTVSATGTTTPQGEVLGVSTSTEPLTCGEYLTLTNSLGKKYLKEGIRNDKDAVILLQKFLNEQLGLSLPVTGYFGPLTTKAVKTFQLLHKDTVLTPWGLTNPTGIVYKTTIARINNLKCSTLNIVIDTKDLR